MGNPDSVLTMPLAALAKLVEGRLSAPCQTSGDCITAARLKINMMPLVETDGSRSDSAKELTFKFQYRRCSQLLTHLYAAREHCCQRQEYCGYCPPLKMGLHILKLLKMNLPPSSFHDREYWELALVLWNTFSTWPVSIRSVYPSLPPSTHLSAHPLTHPSTHQPKRGFCMTVWGAGGTTVLPWLLRDELWGRSGGRNGMTLPNTGDASCRDNSVRITCP